MHTLAFAIVSLIHSVHRAHSCPLHVALWLQIVSQRQLLKLRITCKVKLDGHMHWRDVIGKIIAYYCFF